MRLRVRENCISLHHWLHSQSGSPIRPDKIVIKLNVNKIRARLIRHSMPIKAFNLYLWWPNSKVTFRYHPFRRPKRPTQECNSFPKSLATYPTYIRPDEIKLSRNISVDQSTKGDVMHFRLRDLSQSETVVVAGLNQPHLLRGWGIWLWISLVTFFYLCC